MAGSSAFHIWLLLIALTIVSVLTGELQAAGKVSALVITGISAVKARYIVLDYMEARHAPGPWRLIYEGWLGLCTLIIGIIALVP